MKFRLLGYLTLTDTTNSTSILGKTCNKVITFYKLTLQSTSLKLDEHLFHCTHCYPNRLIASFLLSQQLKVTWALRSALFKHPSERLNHCCHNLGKLHKSRKLHPIFWFLIMDRKCILKYFVKHTVELHHSLRCHQQAKSWEHSYLVS